MNFHDSIASHEALVLANHGILEFSVAQWLSIRARNPKVRVSNSRGTNKKSDRFLSLFQGRDKLLRYFYALYLPQFLLSWVSPKDPNGVVLKYDIKITQVCSYKGFVSFH